MEPIYVVLIINLIIWAGIFYYLTRLNKEVDELKKKLNK
ncbi:MAG TPA: CcmD family protein [Calditrichaeota bacterium]|nr:CcmD family protein [Calditrichota bacterium]